MCSRCSAPATLTTSSTTARRRTCAGRWNTPSARSTCFLFHSHTPKPPDPHLAIRFKTTEPEPGQLPSRTEDSSGRMLPPVSVLPPNATDPPRPSSLPVRSTRRPETLPLMTNVLRRVELVTVTCSRDAAPLIPKLRRQSYRRVSRDCQRARESATDGCPCSSPRPSIPVGATSCGG